MLTGSKNAVIGNSLNVNRFNAGTGISLSGNYNFISNNTDIGNGAGVDIGYAVNAGGSYNIFAGNIVEESGLWGILMGNGSYNVFYGNLIANNGGLGHDGYGLALGEEDIESATNNLFFGNIFKNNSKNFGTNWQVLGSNSFDNGAVGNYWDDYLTKYSNATEVDNSGIGNTPYLV
jgi:parallel beta-helix repeat protein